MYWLSTVCQAVCPIKQHMRSWLWGGLDSVWEWGPYSRRAPFLRRYIFKLKHEGQIEVHLEEVDYGGGDISPVLGQSRLGGKKKNWGGESGLVGNSGGLCSLGAVQGLTREEGVGSIGACLHFSNPFWLLSTNICFLLNYLRTGALSFVIYKIMCLIPIIAYMFQLIVCPEQC